MPETSADEVRRDPDGWFLPKLDTYFDQFTAPPSYNEGSPSEKLGFMRDHLLEAFKHVRAWTTAVDVGAHVGYWTWDLAQKFETVYAFEATPANYECLVRNISPFDNVIARNVAVGDAPGRCGIHHDKGRLGNSGSNYIQPSADGAIEIIALDDMEIPACDLLKIDVEGYELKVLCGAKRLIDAYRPVVTMEVSDHKWPGRFPDIAAGGAERWLLKRGYREVAYLRPDKVFVS
jgi:FkbM family methyltransferase